MVALLKSVALLKHEKAICRRKAEAILEVLRLNLKKFKGTLQAHLPESSSFNKFSVFFSLKTLENNKWLLCLMVILSGIHNW